jgi:hypothetical protein
MPVTQLLKRPSAFMPLAMSFVALCVVVLAVAVFGVVREADEGTAAHLFQLLIAGQAPFVLYFVATVLPRQPREAALVLALQGLALVVAFAPVFALGL